jgi:hypothetical protein
MKCLQGNTKLCEASGLVTRAEAKHRVSDSCLPNIYGGFWVTKMLLGMFRELTPPVHYLYTGEGFTYIQVFTASVYPNMS